MEGLWKVRHHQGSDALSLLVKVAAGGLGADCVGGWGRQVADQAMSKVMAEGGDVVKSAIYMAQNACAAAENEEEWQAAYEALIILPEYPHMGCTPAVEYPTWTSPISFLPL